MLKLTFGSLSVCVIVFINIKTLSIISYLPSLMFSVIRTWLLLQKQTYHLLESLMSVPVSVTQHVNAEQTDLNALHCYNSLRSLLKDVNPIYIHANFILLLIFNLFILASQNHFKFLHF